MVLLHCGGLSYSRLGLAMLWSGWGGEAACRGRLGPLIIFYWQSHRFSLSSAMFETIVFPSLRGEPPGCVAAEEEGEGEEEDEEEDTDTKKSETRFCCSD